MYLDPQNAAADALDAAAALSSFGIELPADGERWLQQLRELQGSRPPQPSPTKVAELMAHGASEEDINAADDERDRWPRLSRDRQEAERICGQHILASIRIDSHDLHAQLSSIADELIAKLHRAAQLPQSVNDLVRADRPDDARLVVHAATDLATLEQLYELRDLYLVPNGTQWSTGRWDASRWSNPQDIKPGNRAGESQWDYCAACIRSGGRLWFPTVAEATAASSKHEPSNLIEAIDPNRRRSGFAAIG